MLQRGMAFSVISIYLERSKGELNNSLHAEPAGKRRFPDLRDWAEASPSVDRVVRGLHWGMKTIWP